MIRDNDAVLQACLTHNGGWTRIVEGDSEKLINKLAYFILFFDALSGACLTHKGVVSGQSSGITRTSV